MKLKATEFVVELEVQAVTCPGVWLCTNGKVTLHLYMLETCMRTSPVNPVFPLLYHDKFTFKKTFGKVLKLSDLQRILSTLSGHYTGKEIIYMELVQWEDCECPNVLATFKTSVTELLYPLAYSGCILAGVDIDLLMEATQLFPGIISPKVEICTKTTIGEVLRTLPKQTSDTIVVNPKVISTKCIPKRNVPVRQRRVCHSYGYHKSRASKIPPEIATANKQNNPATFSPRQRKKKCVSSPRDKIDWTTRKNEASAEDDILENNKISDRKPDQKCLCHVGNRGVLCKLCTKYKYYFDECCCTCVKEVKHESPKIKNCKCKKIDEREPEQIRTQVTKIPKEYVSNKFNNNGITERSPLTSNRSSLAMEIHKRLEKTLGDQRSCTCCLKSRCKETKNEESQAESPSKEPLSGGFYNNLEQFYIELSKRAQKKSKIEM